MEVQDAEVGVGGVVLGDVVGLEGGDVGPAGVDLGDGGEWGGEEGVWEVWRGGDGGGGGRRRRGGGGGRWWGRGVVVHVGVVVYVVIFIDCFVTLLRCSVVDFSRCFL